MAKDPSLQSVSIKKTTLTRLEKLRHPGQSWDGIITELLNIIEQNHNQDFSKDGEVNGRKTTDN